jgi:hypothetical protein
MSGNTWWKPDKHGEEHPEDSSLLAYIRQQQLENQSKIKQHLDIEQCPRCLHRCSELEQVSKTLAVLGQMLPYQHYPELSVARTYAHIQESANSRTFLQAYLHRANTRQRPRKSAMRLVSLPAAFALAILFTVAMLVFADLSGMPLIPRSLQGGTSPSQSGSTGVAPQFASPTPDPALTATANANATAIASQPYIQLCSTSADIAQSHLVICGYNFDAGHKVSLIVIISGRGPVTRHPVLVDEQGEFQDSWYIHNCRNLPIAIFAYEVDNVKVYSPPLGSISFAACPASTPGS